MMAIIIDERASRIANRLTMMLLPYVLSTLGARMTILLTIKYCLSAIHDDLPHPCCACVNILAASEQ